MGWQDAPLVKFKEEEKEVASWRDAPEVPEAEIRANIDRMRKAAGQVPAAEMNRPKPLTGLAATRKAHYAETPEEIRQAKDFLLRRSREQLAGAWAPNLRATALALGTHFISIPARLTGQRRTADYFNRYADSIRQAAAERDIKQPGIVPPIVKRGLRGVGETVPMMALASPLGVYGVIGQAAVVEWDSAITEGKDAGLKGKELAGYAVSQGVIEGSVAGLFQAVGWGGVEKIMGGKAAVATGVSSALKQLGINTLQELPEEVITELGHNVARAVSGVDPDATSASSLVQTVADTTVQTLLTMGVVSAPSVMSASKTSRRLMAEREMLSVAESGKAPTRNQWKKWGMKPEEGKSAKARLQSVEQKAKQIKAKGEALAEVAKTAKEILKESVAGPTETETVTRTPEAIREMTQGALKAPVAEGEGGGYGVEKSGTGFIITGPDGKPAEYTDPGVMKIYHKKGIAEHEARILNQEATPEISAVEGEAPSTFDPTAPLMPFIEKLKQQAIEAEPKKKGFLKEETGARPITGGPLGQRARSDVIGGGGEVDISVGRAEVDTRLDAARGMEKPGRLAKLKEGWETVKHYATRAHAYIPNTTEFSAAREVLRLLKVVPHSGKDDAIRINAAILDPLGPKQYELFGRYAQIRNQLAALDLGQPLRHGFANRAEVEAYKVKLEAVIERTPDVKQALESRREAVREVVGAAVAHDLLPESALQNSETYFHQQVMMYHAASAKYAGGSIYQKTKKSFQKHRVAAEGLESLDAEYDYNTDFLESEVSWMADALAGVQQEQLLDTLYRKYDVYEKFSTEAKQRDVSLNKVVREDGTKGIFQADPGNAFYRAFSIPDKIAQKLQSGILESCELTKGQIKTVLAVGNQRRPAVLPKEIVAELEAAKKPQDPNWLTALNDMAIRAWKILSTIGPKRITAYEIRNMTGDLEPALAAHPEIIFEVKAAAIELRKMMKATTPLTQEMKVARNLGTTSSGFFTSEIGNIGMLPTFAHLDAKQKRFWHQATHPVETYLGAVGPLNNFREDLLRYAALRFYRKALAKGELKHFGASKRAVVRQLQKDMGNDVAAAHMSRQLLGDYGNMTVMGEWFRTKLYPFWSFQEINIKRWPRLAINAFQTGENRAETGKVAAKMFAVAATMRLAQGQAALYVWNNIMAPLIWGCDDDDDLPPNERANPHILLGRTADGSMRVFTNVGASGDFLEWLGINEAISMIGKYKAGQVTGTDIIKEMMKSPLEKMVGSLRPDIKGGFEVLTGQSLFPSPFTPRSVDRGEAVAGIVGLRDEFKWVKGMALGDGTRPRKNYWQRFFYRTLDPRALALNEVYDLRMRFLESKGSPRSGVYPVSEYRTARSAAINEDYDAFVDWKKEFQKKHPADYGSRFTSFLRRMDPISSRLNESDEIEFITEYLTNEQRDKLKVAQDYSAELRGTLAVWWEAASKSGNKHAN